MKDSDSGIAATLDHVGPRQAAEVLSLFGPQGERMHVRARPRKKPADQ